MHRGRVDGLYSRGISLNSTFSSSYGLFKCPISELSVTRGSARVALHLSLLFKLGVVHTRLLFLSMYSARYWLGSSYCYDFSPLKAHDLAKLSGICRSVRSKARAKGLCSVPRVHGRIPEGGRKNNKNAIFINFGYLRYVP